MFWIWMAAVAVFLIMEMISPTFIFFAFAGGAVVSGVYAALSPESYYWQIGLFVVVSVLFLPLTRKLANRITHEAPELSNVDRMIGKAALVTEEIDPAAGGKVQFEGEIWQARAMERIQEQTTVKILSLSGTRVQVERIDKTKGDTQ